MASRVWGVLVKAVGGLILFQPLVAAYLVVVSAPLGLSRFLVTIAFVPVALLAAQAGFGLLASRSWARARFGLWASLHVSFIPVFYWVFSKPLLDGLVRTAVVGTVLYGLYYGMSDSADSVGAGEAPPAPGNEP